MGFSDFGTALLPASLNWDMPNPDAQWQQKVVISQRTSILPQVIYRSISGVAHEKPASTPESTSDSPPSSGQAEAPVRRSRKGHRKSRNGCHTCKKRRIKCQENHPSCDNCVRAGWPCEYPKVKPIPTTSISIVPRIAPSLQSTPYIFSLEDMQLFHCYLTTSYPHLPLKGDSIWTQELPQYAHHHEYLMHAMLALGAAHLSATTNGKYLQSALDHRIKSIHGLNAALLTKPRSTGEWDARYGTLVALSIQAAGMADGIVDFFTTLRGCMIENEPYDDNSVFKPWISQRQTQFGVPEDLMHDAVEYTPEAPALCVEAAAAIEALADLEMGEYERKIWTCLKKAVDSILVSPADTYQAVSASYSVLCLCPADVYGKLFDPSNHVSWLLISYGMSLHALLHLCGAFKFFDGGPPHMRKTKRVWARRINSQLPAEMRKYGEWPLKIAKRTEGSILNDECGNRIRVEVEGRLGYMATGIGKFISLQPSSALSAVYSEEGGCGGGRMITDGSVVMVR